MSGKPSADIFGAFLNAVQDQPRRRGAALAATNPALGASLAFGARAAARPVPDALAAVVRSVGAAGEPATIVELAGHTRLALDALATTLHRGVETGLLEPTDRARDGARAFRLTPLGRQMA
ncbi:hypothetical protein OPKNFCMD_4215 [Methylobacterium crusticola]|uniref:MarR family transcriptional regulator n=1 Tax=Methylobacterium crusticola TaxID=1697972 RepID=A0ABQ4R2G6_9HYPH|nr:hypothetical protein [Methylobacterium crusticola]GJD51461.1 hypothetical protein OPKNFCMD_4215 [Methylobacterium crusticola]